MKLKLKRFQFTSMRFLLAMTFASILMITMLFVGLSLRQEFDRMLIKSISDNSDEILDQVVINLDNYFYSMIDLSDFLTVKMSGNTEYTLQEFNNVIDPTVRSRGDVSSIVLFDEDGNHLTEYFGEELQSPDRIKSQDWFQKILRDEQYIHISQPHVQNVYVGKYPWVISLSRRVGYREDGQYKEGILLIDMNFSVIEDLLTSVNLEDNGYVFLVDQENTLVYHNQQQLIYANIKSENLRGFDTHYNETFYQEESERYINIRFLENVNWRLIGVYYSSDIANAQAGITNYLSLVILIGLFVSITVSVFISSRITKPLMELEHSMKEVQKGNFDIQLEASGEHEVVQLTKSYNIMIRRIRTLMDQIVIEQEAKRKSELNSLQAQINPHFLYNTLDSIIWMAEHEKHDDVIQMTNALASLFRISLSKGKMVIPIEKEVKHAENYLIIQKMRYKEKFDYSFDVDPAIYKYEVLKLILQPIIENSIYHGIRHMVDEGFIHIRGYLDDHFVYFEVEDDGLGMDEVTCNEVLYKGTSSSGVGLNNVHQRIQLMYGQEYGLSIESEIEEGTKIIFRLPRNEVQA